MLSHITAHEPISSTQTRVKKPRLSAVCVRSGYRQATRSADKDSTRCARHKHITKSCNLSFDSSFPFFHATLPFSQNKNPRHYHPKKKKEKREALNECFTLPHSFYFILFYFSFFFSLRSWLAELPGNAYWHRRKREIHDSFIGQHFHPSKPKGTRRREKIKIIRRRRRRKKKSRSYQSGCLCYSSIRPSSQLVVNHSRRRNKKLEVKPVYPNAYREKLTISKK